MSNLLFIFSIEPFGTLCVETPLCLFSNIIETNLIPISFARFCGAIESNSGKVSTLNSNVRTEDSIEAFVEFDSCGKCNDSNGF